MVYQIRIPRKVKESGELETAARPTMAALAKVFSGDRFLRLSDPKIITKVENCLPVLPSLDVISARDIKGRWGLPFGRQIEFSGNPDSGKTTMLILVAAAAQKAGHTVLWVETEYSLNNNRAKNVGVNLEELWTTFPDYLEQGAESIEEAVKAMPKRDEPGYDTEHGLVVCFDSIAATPTKAEFDGAMTDQHVAEFARGMFKFQRRLNSRIAKRNVMIVYSNQLKSKIGVSYGKKTITYGGNAIRYHASIRFECIMIGKLKDKNDEICGINMKLDNQKNKCFIPYRKVEGVEFSFLNGFSYGQNMLYALCEKGLAAKVGPQYNIFCLGKDVKMRKDQFISTIDKDKILGERLRKALDAI